MNLNKTFHHVQLIAGICAVFVLVLSTSGCKEIINNPAAEDLSAAAIQPRIVSTLPVSNSTGPFSLYNRGDGSGKPHFVLRFNKLMYRSSFSTKSFRVQGFDVPATARIGSSLTYDNILTFFIVDSASGYNPLIYRIGRQYTVTLDSTVEDINGNRLSSRYVFTYIPEPYFRVIGMYPINGTKDAHTGTTPYIYFNNRVNAAILSKLQFTPAVPGAWRIDPNDSSVAYFYHAQPLPFGTNFGLTVQGTATDAELHPLNKEYTSAFSTNAFLPTNIYPRNGSTNISLDNGIDVQFNGLIDTGTVRSGFGISPTVAGSLYLYSPSSSFSFSPIDGLHPNTTYTISVSASLKAADGTSTVPTTSTFTTGPFLVQGYPGDGSTNVSRNASIQVYATGRLDVTTIGAALSFSPAITGSLSYYDGSSYFFYYPSAALAANTTYTVTISTALATRAGDHLPAPYTYSFTTGN